MRKKVPFLDVSYTYNSYASEYDEAYKRVMESGVYIGGTEVSHFEGMFANYCGTEFCVGVANGFDALVMSLRALDIDGRHEVIVPSHTFIATWLAVAAVGAKVVPVDVDVDTLNLDLEGVAAALTPKTRAVIPVHLCGLPAPCEDLKDLLVNKGVFLIEDAAQAHGAELDGNKVGGLGDVACFSFYPGKNMGAFGDGGAVVTSNEEIATKVRSIGNYGAPKKYHHEVLGCNSRLDPLQAAFLSIKLKYLDEWNARRDKIASIYMDKLSEVSGLKLPYSKNSLISANHLFVIRHEMRDEISRRLEQLGVETAMHYPVSNHLSGAFKNTHGGMSFPVTEKIVSTCLSLPIGPHMSAVEAEYVCDALMDVLKEIQ